MRKSYEEISLEFLLVTEDVVRCSPGDDIGEDIFE